MSAAAAPRIAAVAIARNEQTTIAACLDSARRALDEIGADYELWLVDSASEDATVAEACRVPGVRCVILPADAPLGPALGRYAGQRVSGGELILYLDGDMLLAEDWLPAALAALDAEPQLAGVAGEMEHSDRGVVRRHVYPPGDYRHADYLGGAALYRRAALEQVGGFNPYLRSEEEEELGARLRKAGFRLRRLRRPMVRHYPKFPGSSLRELRRRIGRGFYFGMGQLIRVAYAERLPVVDPLATVSRHLSVQALLAAGLVCVLAGAAGSGWGWLGGWALLWLLLLAAFAIKARGWRKPLYYVSEWLLAGPSVVRGLLSRPRRPGEFEPRWRALALSYAGAAPPAVAVTPPTAASESDSAVADSAGGAAVDKESAV